MLLAGKFCAEMREHALGMIAGRFFLDHGRFAIGGKPAQKHR